jgi:hypothetical protein
VDKSSRVTNDLSRLFIGGAFILYGYSEVLVGFGIGVVSIALVDIVVESYEWMRMGRSQRWMR